METKSLIDAMNAGDSAQIEVTFNDLMREKVVAGLEKYRQDVTKTLFTSTED